MLPKILDCFRQDQEADDLDDHVARAHAQLHRGVLARALRSHRLAGSRPSPDDLVACGNVLRLRGQFRLAFKAFRLARDHESLIQLGRESLQHGSVHLGLRALAAAGASDQLATIGEEFLESAQPHEGISAYKFAKRNPPVELLIACADQCESLAVPEKALFAYRKALQQLLNEHKPQHRFSPTG